MKTRGAEEIAALRRRVRRQFTLGRIRKGDHDYLVGLLNQMEARVVQMYEKDETGEEAGEL